MERKFFLEKMSHNAEKLKGGTLWDFPTSIPTQNIKKTEGGPFGETISEKKSRSAKKKEMGDPLFSPGMVCYAEKQEIFFVQFARPNGAIWCNNIL